MLNQQLIVSLYLCPYAFEEPGAPFIFVYVLKKTLILSSMGCVWFVRGIMSFLNPFRSVGEGIRRSPRRARRARQRRVGRPRLAEQGEERARPGKDRYEQLELDAPYFCPNFVSKTGL